MWYEDPGMLPVLIGILVFAFVIIFAPIDDFVWKKRHSKKNDYSNKQEGILYIIRTEDSETYVVAEFDADPLTFRDGDKMILKCKHISESDFSQKNQSL